MRAHVGTTGNEAADRAAKEATLRHNIDIQTPKSNAWIKQMVNTRVYREWSESWNNLKMARQTKQFYKFPSYSKANKVMKLNRFDLTRFINIVTGHNRLNYHMSLVNKGETSDQCRFCLMEKETFFHWATDCPRLRSLREDYLADYLPGEDMAWSVQKLVDMSNDPRINYALEPDWE